jgi:hypothetical protein
MCRVNSHKANNNNNNNNNNGQSQTMPNNNDDNSYNNRPKQSTDLIIIQFNSIQFNSIYLCAKLNSPEANYKVSTGKKMRRVKRNK